MKIAKTGTVSGRVQGVFFRASTQKEAQSLGIVGWVRNLPDGRVEIHFGGEADQVEKLSQWLSHGPKMARVDSLDLRACEFPELDRFEIR